LYKPKISFIIKQPIRDSADIKDLPQMTKL